MRLASELAPMFSSYPKKLAWALEFAERSRIVLGHQKFYRQPLKQLDQRIALKLQRSENRIVSVREYQDWLDENEERYIRKSQMLEALKRNVGNKDIPPLPIDLVRMKQDMSKTKGIVGDVMSEIEVPHGLVQVATIMGVLTPDMFNGMLAKGQLPKDPTINSSHGEYTHRLQLDILMLYMQQRGESAYPLLLPDGMLMVDFVKALPNFQVDEEHAGSGTYARPWLWDGVFDRNGVGSDNLNSPFNTETMEDISSPENFMKFLESEKQAAPFLAAFVGARSRKRKIQGFGKPFNPYEAGANYYAEDNFDKFLFECTPEERALAYDAQAGTVFVSRYGKYGSKF